MSAGPVPPTRIIIFAKAPLPGEAKTRLIPRLGAAGAAALAGQMLADTVRHALTAGLATPELCTSPAPGDARWAGHLPVGVRLGDQGSGDLGDRLARAAARAIDEGDRVLLIGTDCPDLDAKRLAEAAAHLDQHDAVLYPAHDGGYVLLGLKRTHPSLFAGIAWSTAAVAATTITRVHALGWSLFVGETLRDIDEPADLDAEPVT